LKKDKKTTKEDDVFKEPIEETSPKETDSSPVEQDTKTQEDPLAAQKDKYLRLAAEYDNYRKRTSAEKAAIYSNACADTVLALLPIADSIDQALSGAVDAPPEFLKGLELIKTQLDTAFGTLKIEPFGQIGDDFNPEIHNAIAQTPPEDNPPNTIAAVYQKGYKTADKVIRHAIVQVYG
jgi:molecular chaperone GrpE